jgi:hypothetical protein
MAYMETRAGNRKALQHIPPQRPSGMRGRRIIDQEEPLGGSGIRYLTGPHHRTASDEQRCGPTIGYSGPYSRSWESRTRTGVKLDAIPSAHDHIAMYKRMGMDFPINLVRKQPFRVPGVHCRGPCPLIFIFREPGNLAAVHGVGRSRDVFSTAPPENPAPRP